MLSAFIVKLPTSSVHIIKHVWSRDHATSSLTAVLPAPGQFCGTVCLNSFSNRTSLSNSDRSNDRWKRLCLVSWVPCVWTL